MLQCVKFMLFLNFMHNVLKSAILSWCHLLVGCSNSTICPLYKLLASSVWTKSRGKPWSLQPPGLIHVNQPTQYKGGLPWWAASLLLLICVSGSHRSRVLSQSAWLSGHLQYCRCEVAVWVEYSYDTHVHSNACTFMCILTQVHVHSNASMYTQMHARTLKCMYVDSNACTIIAWVFLTFQLVYLRQLKVSCKEVGPEEKLEWASLDGRSHTAAPDPSTEEEQRYTHITALYWSIMYTYVYSTYMYSPIHGENIKHVM